MKRSLSKFSSGVAKRKKNPEGGEGGKSGLWDDVVSVSTELVLPGVAAYAGTRIAGRIGYAIGRRRSAAMARHLVPLSSLAAAIAAIILAGKWEKLSAYKTGIMVGSGIAAVQSVLQAYVPQWAWVLADPNEDATRLALNQPVMSEADSMLEEGYIEQLPGMDLGPGPGFSEKTPSATTSGGGGIDIDDFSDIPGMDGTFKSGIFS